MSKYKGGCPADLYDDDDADDYCETFQQSSSRSFSSGLQNQNMGIKIIPSIGVQAGLNKTNFDIQLEVNAQQWFDQIHQCWRQCKLRNYEFRSRSQFSS